MEDKQAKGTCRDYERGVCNRGNRCKFYHPENVPQPDNKKLPICKDFQNKGCDRKKCKFLHITQDEEAHYNATGKLPEHGGRLENAPLKHANAGGAVSKDRCKDFMNGICQRSNCRFSHAVDGNTAYTSFDPVIGYGKRRRDEFGAASLGLMEENEMLRRKISDLQRQVIDLRQMNDTLYDQNTRYRDQLRGPITTSDPLADPYMKSVALYPSSLSTAGYGGYTKF